MECLRQHVFQHDGKINIRTKYEVYWREKSHVYQIISTLKSVENEFRFMDSWLANKC